MKDYTKKLDEIIREAIIIAPELQISPQLLKESRDFFSEERTLTESYDYFCSVSKKPITEVSSFVRTLCDVGKFYKRPN